MDAFLVELQRVLMLLSSSHNIQIQYLTSLGVPVDELALELDDISGLIPNKYELGILTKEEFFLLDKLHTKLDLMSNEKHLWDIDSLINSAEWNDVRQIASEALVLLK